MKRIGSFVPETTLHAAVAGYRVEPFTFTYPKLTETVDTYPVGCTPDSSETRRIMAQAVDYWNVAATTQLTVKYFATEAQMEKFYMSASRNERPSNIGVGIVFADANVETLSYTLRFQPDVQSPSTGKPYIVKKLRMWQ